MKLLNKQIKGILVLSLALSFLLLSPPVTLAKSTNVFNFGSIFNHTFNFSNTGGNTGGSVHTGNALARQSLINVINTSSNPPTSVPEFGAIPGAIAAFISGGIFFFLKKRYN